MKPFGKILLSYLIVIPMIGGAILLTYFKLDTTLESLEATMMNNETVHTQQFSHNITEIILKHTGSDLLESFRESPLLQQRVEELLSSFIAEHYAYVYLVYRDDKGKYRYLVDGSKEVHEKGKFGQKFDVDYRVWNQAYDNSMAKIITEKENEQLWNTHLYPIVTEGETRALLVFDFSDDEYLQLQSLLEPIRTILFYLSVLMLMLFLFALVQVYTYYRSRTRSLVDPLTTAYNRLFLEELIPLVDLNTIQLCMMDIDHFKKVNDIYGHSVGDFVLQNVVKRILSQIKKDDMLIRYGGEEFLLIFRDPDKNMKRMVFERIAQSIKQEPYNIEGNTIHITASFGVNSHPEFSESIKDAIRIADTMLYCAKEQGRDCIIYDESSINQKS